MQGSTCFDIDVHYRLNPKPVFEACNPYESLTEHYEYGYRRLAVVKSPNTIRDPRWTKSIVWVQVYKWTASTIRQVYLNGF